MKGKTQRYYDQNPDKKTAKKKYDTEYGKKPSARKKRAELNKENRKRGHYGNNDHKDLSHTSKGLVYKSEKANRGSTKDSKGDRKARGKK